MYGYTAITSERMVTACAVLQLGALPRCCEHACVATGSEAAPRIESDEGHHTLQRGQRGHNANNNGANQAASNANCRLEVGCHREVHRLQGKSCR